MSPSLSRRLRRSLCVLLLLLMCGGTVLGGTRSQYEKALLQLEQKDYTGALATLHSLESTLVNPADVSNLLAVAYLGQGFQSLSVADFDAARDAFRSGRRYRDDDVRLWLGEAIAWFQQGQYAESVSALDQALGVEPANPEIHLWLGKAYYAEGRMNEALDALQRSQIRGGGDEVTELLGKVRRELEIEQEMTQHARGHFHVSFMEGGPTSDLASDILEVLEEAYVELGALMNYYPDVRVPVLLYSRRDYVDVTRSPDWAGAVYDGKIRIPLAGRQGMSRTLAAMLYHEYMHVLVHFMAHRHVPVWLNEGLAEISARRIEFAPLAVLPEAIASDRLMNWDVLGKPFFRLPHQQVRLAYEQSYSLARFMVDSYGWHHMADLLQRLGRRQPWQTAVAAVYQGYGLDWPAILTEWRARLD